MYDERVGTFGVRLDARYWGGGALLASLVAAGCGGEASPPPARLTVEGPAAISFPAVVDAAGFTAGDDLIGYHLVVWGKGGAAGGALFRTAVSDVEVLDALEALGAVSGNGLGIESWDERLNPQSPAPDRVIVGPPVEVRVRSADGQELGLGDILEDPGGRGFVMRFGGHRDNIRRWHSGCVVCLYSCPGSKVGNAGYTVRDFVDGATHFRPRAGILPADGSEVQIVLRLVDESPSPAAEP